MKAAQHTQGRVFSFCISLSQVSGTCYEVHCTRYGRHTAALGDESPINTPCESVRSAFSYTVSGTTSGPVILFALPFYRASAFTHCVALRRSLICASALVKQESYAMHACLPSHTSFTQSLTSHFCPACSLHSSICGWCLVQPHKPAGLRRSQPREREKNVSARSKMWPSVSRIPLIFLAEDYREPLERHTKDTLHCGAAPVHISQVTWPDFIERGICFSVCLYRTWCSTVQV